MNCPACLRPANAMADGKCLDCWRSSFVKADADKPMLSLIEPKFQLEMGIILTHGAKEYGRENWHACTEPWRYRDALDRHRLKAYIGEYIDPDHGQSHYAAVAVNAMFLWHLERKCE